MALFGAALGMYLLFVLVHVFSKSVKWGSYMVVLLERLRGESGVQEITVMASVSGSVL